MTQKQVEKSVMVFLVSCLVAVLLCFYGSMPVEHTLYKEVTHQEYQEFKKEHGPVPFAGWTWAVDRQAKCKIYKKTSRWFGSTFTVEKPYIKQR